MSADRRRILPVLALAARVAAGAALIGGGFAFLRMAWPFAEGMANLQSLSGFGNAVVATLLRLYVASAGLLLISGRYVLAARLALGGVLIYSGLSKLQGAWQFAEAIANFRILPAQLNQLLAVILPWCELFTGLLLVCRLWLRASALVSMLMFTTFAIAVTAAMARGLDIDCGCFGTESASRAGLQTLAIDVLGLTAALTVLRLSHHPARRPVTHSQ